MEHLAWATVLATDALLGTRNFRFWPFAERRVAMFGQTNSIGAAVAAGTTQVPVSRPPPVQRVVEGTEQARLQQQQTRATLAKPSPLKQLSDSARQFADVLDTTGSVQVAMSISGFRAGHLDVYV